MSRTLTGSRLHLNNIYKKLAPPQNDACIVLTAHSVSACDEMKYFQLLASCLYSEPKALPESL